MSHSESYWVLNHTDKPVPPGWSTEAISRFHKCPGRLPIGGEKLCKSKISPNYSWNKHSIVPMHQVRCPGYEYFIITEPGSLPYKSAYMRWSWHVYVIFGTFPTFMRCVSPSTDMHCVKYINGTQKNWLKPFSSFSAASFLQYFSSMLKPCYQKLSHISRKEN